MAEAHAQPAVALSLVAHTNVGKTTLARTLLRRDIGEVRDATHVTLVAERHTLVEAAGARLELWDTPGFGDSLRLAARLRRAGNPIGWFLNEVWDRWRDRALWSSQNAVRNVLEEADLVLYLVSAAEVPEDAAYVAAELEVLDLLGRPTLVLLNQTGPPRPTAQEAAELERWRSHCRAHACVRDVLALDAFARCWVQEGVLLEAVARALPADLQTRFEPLRRAWLERLHATWGASMDVLGARLARAAVDREPIEGGDWRSRWRDLGAALGLHADALATPRAAAMSALAGRLDADIGDSTDALIRLHGLSGRAGREVLARLAEHYAVRAPLSEGKAAVWGGLVSGALAGLKADIATGGMTLGGGLLAGGLVGALGAAGLARGVNLLRGTDKPTLAWNEEVLDGLARAALLAYLAVAHCGRGRGDWVASEHPAFWSDAVDRVLAQRREALVRLWVRREAADAAERLPQALSAWFADASRALLLGLYPDAAAVLSASPARASR